VLAYASVAGQLVALLQRGGNTGNEASLVASVLIGALLLGYVSAGVVRARTVRLVLAWVVLGISAIGELIALATVDDLGEAVLDVLALAVTAVSLGALAKFRHTPWFAWQRTKPPAREGAPITNLVAIAVCVGVLGGFVGPVDPTVDVEVRVSAHVR
jgi:hypothetical protein